MVLEGMGFLFFLSDYISWVSLAGSDKTINWSACRRSVPIGFWYDVVLESAGFYNCLFLSFYCSLVSTFMVQDGRCGADGNASSIVTQNHGQSI